MKEEGGRGRGKGEKKRREGRKREVVREEEKGLSNEGERGRKVVESNEASVLKS